MSTYRVHFKKAECGWVRVSANSVTEAMRRAATTVKRYIPTGTKTGPIIRVEQEMWVLVWEPTKKVKAKL